MRILRIQRRFAWFFIYKYKNPTDLLAFERFPKLPELIIQIKKFGWSGNNFTHTN